MLDGQLHSPSVGLEASNGAVQPQLPNSDSIPTLSPSGSQDVSLDDSRGPATAESSLIRSDSAKTVPSLAASNDVVTETADIDFSSIYNAYRASNSTMASRFTAPVFRIEVRRAKRSRTRNSRPMLPRPTMRQEEDQAKPQEEHRVRGAAGRVAEPTFLDSAHFVRLLKAQPVLPLNVGTNKRGGRHINIGRCAISDRQ